MDDDRFGNDYGNDAYGNDYGGGGPPLYGGAYPTGALQWVLGFLCGVAFLAFLDWLQ